MIHELKTIPKYFKEVYNQNKRFEFRLNDRNFKINDILVLKEFNPKTKVYSGSEVIVKVTYIMSGKTEFIDLDNYVIMSIKTIDFTH